MYVPSHMMGVVGDDTIIVDDNTAAQPDFDQVTLVIIRPNSTFHPRWKQK